MKQIRVPSDIFQKIAKREYYDWHRALVREFVQNSVDAGATRKDFNITEADDHTVLTVADNGHGMSLETCEDRLLTLGGSDKNVNSVGGFGVAKHILYFAWASWSIRSRTYKITGEGCNYSIEENLPYQPGVISTIVLPKSDGFSAYHIRTYLQHCETRCSFYINGEQYVTQTKKGRRIRTLGEWGTLYKKNTENGVKLSSYYLYVRVNGISMFHLYTGTLDCQLVLELHGDTKSILTSNRDGLQQPYMADIQALVTEIAINNKSALKEQEDFLITTFKGNGHTIVRFTEEQRQIIQKKAEEAVSALSVVNLEKVATLPPEKPIKESKDLVLPEAETLKESPKEESTVSSIQIDTTEFKKTETLPRSFPNAPDRIQYEESPRISFDRPDIIVRSIGGNVSKKFSPGTWSFKVKSVLALWHKVIVQVLKDNKVDCIFGIGITLDPDNRAEFLRHDGIPYFLINPESWHHQPKLAKKWMIVQELRIRAVHEIAHFASGKDHNENFILTMNALLANTWINEASYDAIAKLRKVSFD